MTKLNGQTPYPCAVEMPVELWVNDKKITVFLCTPSDLEDLAAGHLLVRGMISSFSHIKEIAVDYSRNVIQVFTVEPTKNLQSLYSVSDVILSGCSAVAEFNSQVYRLPSVSTDYRISLEEISGYGAYMVKEAKIYKETGGVHAALLCTGNQQFLREDIGRHNAVDKAVGAASRAGIDFSHSSLVTTGRISLDMALKAASVSLPVIGTLKDPSDLGVRLASYYHICIVARITSESPLVYTAETKILNS